MPRSTISGRDGPAFADFEDENKPYWCDGDYDERTGFCQDAYTGEWYNQFGEVYDEHVPPPENERAWFDLGLFDEDYDRPEDTPWCDANFYEFGNVGVVYNWKEGDWIVSLGPFSCGDNEDDDPENNEGSRDNWP